MHHYSMGPSKILMPFITQITIPRLVSVIVNRFLPSATILDDRKDMSLLSKNNNDSSIKD